MYKMHVLCTTQSVHRASSASGICTSLDRAIIHAANIYRDISPIQERAELALHYTAPFFGAAQLAQSKSNFLMIRHISITCL